MQLRGGTADRLDHFLYTDIHSSFQIKRFGILPEPAFSLPKKKSRGRSTEGPEYNLPALHLE
jgi:hypothetical protein